MFLKLECAHKLPGNLVKMQILIKQVWAGHKIYTSNNFPGYINTLGPWTTFWLVRDLMINLYQLNKEMKEWKKRVLWGLLCWELNFDYLFSWVPIQKSTCVEECYFPNPKPRMWDSSWTCWSLLCDPQILCGEWTESDSHLRNLIDQRLDCWLL